MGMRITVIAMAFLLSAEAAAPAGGQDGASAAKGGMDLRAEWKRQFDQLAGDIKARGSAPARRAAGQAYDPSATILADDRDGLDIVLRRTAALLADLCPTGVRPGGLDQAGRQLEALRTRAASIGPSDSAGRYGVYEDLCRLRRRIAFANPLLNFEKLLLVRRHDAKGVIHMCDQYYGFNAQPGGSLVVLEGPFTDSPRAADPLAGKTVQAGRLAGRTLEGGSFLSPELSFDGRTVFFAWTACKGKNLEWSPDASYHVFRLDLDGGGLSQLTDGPTDDFDPCLLPDGRVVFVSERRGGYLRCGRHCPTYTMFVMNADGGGIECFSFHETHEWHPSVANDGRIVYTRWDYIDRDTNVAHHIWLCYPDGRDPRSFHGNYPLARESRPWMEMSIRAIPGSTKFVATAASHHGHAFGSLVVIDQDAEDDGAMAQVRRLTPDAPMPEAEGPWAKNNAYATAWPLSEKYYLAAYDPAGKNHGIYLVDCFGNRELIWRDWSIACLDPIPLRVRPCPPVIPPQATAPAPAAQADRDGYGTVAVMNVYDSDFAWPADAKVTHLRIIQVLPKTTAPPNVPRIGAGEQTNARAVLGTVPVEADGSCQFRMPAGKCVYFQALDANGLAVQSMRSATYVQPGRVLSCQGCHEPKHSGPAAGAAVPLAMRRPPSDIQPECEGANPFSYVRLVQPVLDKHCADCHRKEKALDLSSTPTKSGFTASYDNLATKYGSFYDVANGSIKRGPRGGTRSVPGQFGAGAAKLTGYLTEKHHGVKMSAEEIRRVTLWLDCNSEFLGAYENPQAQVRGEIVKPALE
jgi:hypothetical protein